MSDVATSLALIGVLGILSYGLMNRLKLPGFLGLLILGMAIGPFGLNWMDADLMKVSGEFRKMALIVILLRAGLGISRDDLNAVGKTALFMSVIPGIFEGVAILITAVYLFDWHWLEAGMLGFILAAVSPAVIVPSMLHLQAKGYGAKHRVPTMILAAASIDDVVAITIFSVFMGLYSGASSVVGGLVKVPIGLVLGVGLGLGIGAILVWSFKRYHMRDTKKVMLMVGAAILLTSVEEFSRPWLPIASLMGVMAMGLVTLELLPVVAKRLSIKFSKVWVLAEVLLFVLVGAQVNIGLAWDAGLLGLALLAIGLAARSIGVLIATSGSPLTMAERGFSVVSFWPKATVQAAIGAVPLMAGVPSGPLILAIAVLAILISAPLGSVAIESTAQKWLKLD